MFKYLSLLFFVTLNSSAFSMAKKVISSSHSLYTISTRNRSDNRLPGLHYIFQWANRNKWQKIITRIKKDNSYASLLDQDGDSILAYAIRKTNNKKVILSLISYCDPYFPNKSGYAPIQNAIIRGKEEFLKCILEKINKNIIHPPTGQSLAHFAADPFYENSKILEILYTNKYSLHSQDLKGNYPIHYSARVGHDQSIKFFLDHFSTSIDSLDLSENTPLNIAIKNFRGSTVELLLSKKANPNLPNKEKDYPIHIAAKLPKSQASLEIIKNLIKYGADLNKENKEGKKPVEIASIMGSSQHLATFMEEDETQIHTKNRSTGNTLLHSACIAKNYEVIKFITEKRLIKPLEKNKFDQNCFELTTDKNIIKQLTTSSNQI